MGQLACESDWNLTKGCTCLHPIVTTHQQGTLVKLQLMTSALSQDLEYDLLTDWKPAQIIINNVNFLGAATWSPIQVRLIAAV